MFTLPCDENGELCGTIINSNYYHYIKNIFGDILGLVDEDGGYVADYTYDAWGNILSATASINNSIRYKGYYYDSETDMYYCHTRYYVPKWLRWLNSDNVEYLDTDDFAGINRFVYCGNNPVIAADPDGCSPFWKKVGKIAAKVGKVVGGAILAAVATAATVITSSAISIPGAAAVPEFCSTMAIYGGAVVASAFNKDVENDLRLINWNPFNSDAEKASLSKYISFYKGATVFRTNGNASAGFLGMILLHRREDGISPDYVRHEYGHVLQGKALGFLLFAGIIAVPSITTVGSEGYDSFYFERWADKWGRVSPYAPWKK